MNDILNTSALTDDQMGHLAYVVNSPSWLDFFEPLLREAINASMSQLADPSITRKNARPDDFLRGQIVALRNLLDMPHFVLEDQRERHKTQAADDATQLAYADRATNGFMRPMTDYEPSEDEY